MGHSAILKVCLCAFGLVFFEIICAQTITVKSISLQPSDQTAIEQPCFDINGGTCALLKIKTDNLEGIEFPNVNQYIKKDYSAGIYHVYVPDITKKLDLRHKDYMPVQIDMSDYGYKKLRKGKTYLIVLDAPKKVDLKSSVIIKIEPKQAQIIFDDQTYEANRNGTFEFPVSVGNHVYEVFAPDYQSQNGTITIGKSEAKTISVRLQPITHEVIINSNVATARVFVDNTEWGGIGKLSIPQGEHTIRVQANGYVDMAQNVTINASTAPLSFQLKENKRTTHIHPTPVTIYSKSPRIFQNNKEIKGWTNGATIKLMPGEYRLSDNDDEKNMTIIVGKDSLKVNLDSGKWGLANMNIEEDVTPNTQYIPSSASSFSPKQEENNNTAIRNYSTPATNSSRSNYYNRITNQSNYNRSTGSNFNRNNSSNNNTVTRSAVNNTNNSRNTNRNNNSNSSNVNSTTNNSNRNSHGKRNTSTHSSNGSRSGNVNTTGVRNTTGRSRVGYNGGTNNNNQQYNGSRRH